MRLKCGLSLGIGGLNESDMDLAAASESDRGGLQQCACYLRQRGDQRKIMM